MRMQRSANPPFRPIPTVITMILFVVMQFLVVGAAFLGGYLVNQWGTFKGAKASANFAVLDEAYQLLENNAVFPLPEPKKLEYGMIRGMITTVNEPYTVFVEPAQHELQSQRLQGKFGGIGVRIERDDQGNVHLFPLPNSPAVQAGMTEGDRLFAVGELVVTPQTSNDDLQSAIRGPVGEPVKVTIGHPPAYQPLDLVITRAEVALPSVTWNQIVGEPRVGIIHINVIANTTPDEVTKAVNDLQSRGVSRFIVDVRNNGGGLVEAGVNTARLFLKTGVVIEEQYRGQDVKSYKVEQPGALADIKMVLLVNKATASSSEIFAGAIKAQKRALVVGTPTYGKDTIQLVFRLSDGSSLHVTSAHWWVPGLEPKIGGNGIQPDVLVNEQASEAQILQAAVDTVLK